jgi:hypothetical protein
MTFQSTLNSKILVHNAQKNPPINVFFIATCLKYTGKKLKKKVWAEKDIYKIDPWCRRHQRRRVDGRHSILSMFSHASVVV